MFHCKCLLFLQQDSVQVELFTVWTNVFSDFSINSVFKTFIFRTVAIFQIQLAFIVFSHHAYSFKDFFKIIKLMIKTLENLHCMLDFIIIFNYIYFIIINSIRLPECACHCFEVLYTFPLNGQSGLRRIIRRKYIYIKNLLISNDNTSIQILDYLLSTSIWGTIYFSGARALAANPFAATQFVRTPQI